MILVSTVCTLVQKRMCKSGAKLHGRALHEGEVLVLSPRAAVVVPEELLDTELFESRFAVSGVDVNEVHDDRRSDCRARVGVVGVVELQTAEDSCCGLHSLFLLLKRTSRTLSYRITGDQKTISACQYHIVILRRPRRRRSSPAADRGFH